jgi:hypothetical protein
MVGATLPPLSKAKRLRRPKPKKVRDSGKSDGETRPAELPKLERAAAELPPLPPSLTGGLDTNREPLFMQAGTKKPMEDFADLNAADVIAIAIKVQAHWRGQVARSRWREATRQIRECCWCLQCEHDVEVSGSQPSHPVKSLIARLETRVVVIHFPSSDRRSYYVVIYADDSTLVECPGRWGWLSAISISYVNRFSMALLYGRAGHLNTKNGGFRPGQLRRRSGSRCSCGRRNTTTSTATGWCRT